MAFEPEPPHGNFAKKLAGKNLWGETYLGTGINLALTPFFGPPKTCTYHEFDQNLGKKPIPSLDPTP